MLNRILEDSYKEEHEATKRQKEEERQRKAAENRKRYPVTAEIVDEFRAAGFDVKVISTNEEQK